MIHKEGWQTTGVIPGRSPQPENFDLSFFQGQKENQVSYPRDATYLNPDSEYSKKFIDILGWIRSFVASGTVLDVGAGPGHLQTWAKRKRLSFKVTNLDVSHEILSWSKEYLETEDTINGIGNTLPFASETFDAVLLSDVLEHMWPDEAQNSVRESFRVLKNEGRIFINIPNRNTWDDTWFKISSHVWVPSIGEMRMLLQEEHFNPDSIHYFTRGFPMSNKWRARTGKDVKLPVFGRSIFITAKK